MALIEKTAYPRITNEFLDSSKMKTHFYPTDEEVKFTFLHTRTQQGALSFLLLLKVHQFLGYTIAIHKVPIPLQKYLRGRLDFDETILPLEESSANKTTIHRYRNTIRQFLQIKPWSNEAKKLVTSVAEKAAYTMSAPADLINIAVEVLAEHRYELPAFSTLDRLAKHIRQKVHDVIYQKTVMSLTPNQRVTLDNLLTVSQDEHQSDFNKIKATPSKNTLPQMRLWAQRLNWLNSIIDPTKFIEDIPHTKVRQFAAQTKQLELGDLKDISKPSKRYTFLLCFLYQAQTNTRDELITMFLKRIRKTHYRAKEQLKILQEQYRKWEEQMMAIFNQMLACADEPKDAVFGKQVRTILEKNGGASNLSEQYQMVAAYHGKNHLPLLWSKHKAHRKAIFRLLDLLKIESATQDDDLLAAFNFIKENQNARKEYLPDEIELDFLSTRWKNHIVKQQGKQTVLKRRELEIGVLSYLADALRNGDLYVDGSEEFADARKQLLPWETCLTHLERYCKGGGLPNNAEEFIAQLQKELHATAQQTDNLFPENTAFTIDEQGHPHLKRLRAETKPDGLKIFQDKIRQRMPERQLLDMLKDVQHWSNFTKHFSPPSGANNKMSDALSHYLFAVFGYGCNLGAAQTARHITTNISLRTLKRVNDQHVTSPKLQAASTDIINQYARFDLPLLWGSGKTAAADGTHIPLRQNNLMGEQHIRYGSYGGIAYHHISDTYVALFCNFIACGVWEAVYILDGLLKNTSKLQPDTVHADTQGQSEPVFGLSYLLGIKLMPRMRNWNDVKFYKTDQSDTYNHIDQLFCDTINWKLIKTHWKDLMQVVISIQQGKILPSMILKKLGTDSRKNKLYKAFRELGRVIRTIFLLQYVNSKTMRQKIQAATNKVESFHFFHDWITFGGATITTGDPVEQLKRNQYIDLIANAVMLHNVVDLTNIINQLIKEKETVTPEFIKHLSPYMTEHIKRFGQYVLDLDDLPEPLTFTKFVFKD